MTGTEWLAFCSLLLNAVLLLVLYGQWLWHKDK